MRKIFFTSLILSMGLITTAQNNDPIIMVVAGTEIPRSEFEYSYNKNNTEMVIDKKSLNEYVELFVNYRLKVAAAEEERLDTVASFIKECAEYRSQQAEDYLIDTAFIEENARKTYEMTKENIGPEGMFLAAHILLRLPQQASLAEQNRTKELIDSIYGELQNGADFSQTAEVFSQDPGTARQGGMLPWFYKNQMLKEFEDQVMALQPGEMSKPFLSPVGYHIVLLKERKQFEPYEYHQKAIYQFLEQRGIRAAAKHSLGKKLAAEMGGGISPEEALIRAEKELDDKHPDFKYLMKEFRDGSLLYEISTREVWDKAAKDEQGLAKFFKKNKKKYAYEEPVYRGLVVHCTSEDILKQVKKITKKQPQKEWVRLMRESFNTDSLVQVKMIRGPFKVGQNNYADYYAFGQGEQPKAVEGFPVTAVIGKLQKKGPDTYEDVRGAVTADYQNSLEQLWVNSLRKKYPITIYHEVVETVNQH